MLGILLIYFVGKAFYNLAEKHNRSKWLFAILGVVVYYGVQFIIGILLALSDSAYVLDNIAMTIVIGLGSGLLGSGIFYLILKNNWEKNKKVKSSDSELLDEL